MAPQSERTSVRTRGFLAPAGRRSIARGTGQEISIDSELVSACLPIAEVLTRTFRGAGVFGDDLPVAEDADQQIKLLALVGRRP